LPNPYGGWIAVEWENKDETIAYACRSDGKLRILRPAGETVIFETGQNGKWEFPISQKTTL
jgi:hypothetical protein